MRFLTLHLTAFGPFTDLLLDLSAGHHGLHIIHGPNEAGKSASLRALSALLFGIPATTSDNFVHDYRSLRIGATLLHSDGSRIEVVRRKGLKDTLLTSSGAPLPEGALAKYLGGVEEALFTMMFGLNHSGLLRGGEEILRAGGALGESIFSAGLGATHLRDVLRGLAEEAERLFKPKGSLQAIAQSITAYKEAKDKLQAAALPSKDWLAEEQAFHQASARKALLDEELGHLSAEKTRIERFLKALPLLAERKGLLARRQALGPVRLLAPDFSKTRRDLTLQRAKLVEQEQSAARLVADLEAKIDLLQVDRSLLEHEPRILELHERLGGYRKGARDIARLQTERQQLLSDAAAILRDIRPDLELDQVEALRLTTTKRSRVRHLAAQSQALDERLARSTEDVRRLTQRLNDTRERLSEADSPRDPAPLRALLVEIRKQGSLQEELTRLLSKQRAESEQASIELARLELWQGDLFDLEKLPVPSQETVDRYDAGFQQAHNAIGQARDRAMEVDRALSDADRKIETLQLAVPVPTEEDLEQARSHRERGWSLVRRSWLEGVTVAEATRAYDSERPLPEAFESSVREADTVSDRLRREANRVAELASLLAQKKQLADLSARNRSDLEAAQNHLAALQTDWSAAWQPCGIAPLTPKEMRGWIARKDKLVSAAQTLRLDNDRAAELRQRIDAFLAMLTAQLQDLTPGAETERSSLESLLDRCAAVVERIESMLRTRQDLIQAIDEMKRELDDAVRAADRAALDLSRWQEAWTEAMDGLGLASTTLPFEASALIERIEDLFKQLDKAESLATRTEAARQDRQRFEDDARALASGILPETTELPPDQITAELYARYQKAAKDAAARSELEAQRSRQLEIRLAARGQLNEIAVQLQELCLQAGCPSPEDLDEAEEKSHQALMLQRELESIERQLLEYSAGASLDTLAHEASLLEPDLLPQRLREIMERVEMLEAERAEALAAAVRAEHNLERMDGRADAAEAAERAQSALARIREDANAYVRLRLAHAILVREIERYRSENQDPLVRRAGEIFQRLTLGSFASLRADYSEQDEPILVGVRPNGRHVLVSGMSEGTRDQLYLCLRLASLERHASRNEPIPFVVDDILVNFDDRRATAAIQVLEELSRLTQVILYTHHDHLVDLARRSVSPDALFIHPLTAE
ncbi:MAG: AAA family ATPase [Syntrophobacteraceae bacterium]